MLLIGSLSLTYASNVEYEFVDIKYTVFYSGYGANYVCDSAWV